MSGRGRSVVVSIGVHDALRLLSDGTGLSMGKLADSLLEYALGVARDGGGLYIDMDGNVRVGGGIPRVAVSPQTVEPVASSPDKAPPGSEERAAEILRSDEERVLHIK